MRNIFSDFHHEITGNVKEHPTLLENSFCNFLIEIERSIHCPETDVRIPENIRKARSHIESNFSISLSIARLAESASLSPSHFRSEFFKYIGFSPKEYLVHLRMLNACVLLADQELRIKEVARRVGYADIYHFSKLFKKYHGMSPQRMRKGENRPPSIS